MHLSAGFNKQASTPFELVNSNVWGPCPVMSPTRFKYFVTFVDDFSRVIWLYLMKSCSELFYHFSVFCAEIETQIHVSIQILRSDNAKEYLSKPFQSFMLHHGILHQISCEKKNPLIMGQLREIIDIFLRLSGLFCSICMPPNTFGLMQSLPPVS